MIENYSVLMSVYRGEKPEFFRLALESMCTQTLLPDEIVLVCDGPLTVDLEAVIQAFDTGHPGLFHLIRFEENRGLGFALQAGLQACKNDYVARMDTDDIAVPNRMEMQMAELVKHPEVSVIGGQIAEFCDDPKEITGYRMVKTSPEEVRKAAARRCPMNHMTVLMRKADVIAAGNYQHCDKFEDYHLWARLLSKGYSLMNLDQVCVLARVGGGMYRRRGGCTYFKQTVALEKYLLACGICSRWQYVTNLIIRFLGTVAVPSNIRQRVYNLLLRHRRLR